MAKPRTKYAKVLRERKAQVYLGTEPAYQDRVNEEKDRLRQMLLADGGKVTSSRLAKLVSKQRLKIKGIEEVLGDANLSLEAAQQMLVEQYDADDLTSLRLDDGGSVRVQPEPYTKVEDKAALRKWCEENGLSDQLTLPWQTLNGVTKERLLDGQDEPTGTSVWIKNKVVVEQGDPEEE